MRIRPAYQNVLGRATFELNATGNGTGVSALRMQASANTTLTLIGDANFYTNDAGSEGESKTWTITSGALRTIYLKCTGTARLIIPEQRLITQWGNSASDGWTSSTNAAQINSAGFPLNNLIQIRITGNSSFLGSLPFTLTYLRFDGANVNWTYNGAVSNILTVLYLFGNNINWTYSGELSNTIVTLILIGNNISWTHTGATPTSLWYLELDGFKINWAGFNVSGNVNISSFRIANFVTTAMTAAQLITLLTSMAGRSGNLPATCTIADYSNSPTATAIRDATADQNGTDAEKAKYWITQIFANKATTRVALQSVNIDKP